jgi:hypothetical protein
MGEPPPKRVRQPSNFRQQDVARAIKAAKSSGLDIAKVEVDPMTAKITMTMKNSAVVETNPFETPTRRRKSKTNAR